MSSNGSTQSQSKSRSQRGNKSKINTSSFGRKPQEKEMKFAVMSSSNTNKYYPYDTVKKTIVNKLKENPTYTDVAAAIQELEPLDMTNLEPVKKLSTIDPFDTEEDGTMTLNQRKEHQKKLSKRVLTLTLKNLRKFGTKENVNIKME